MSDFPEGTPCWVDVTLPDPRLGKRFYGELFGWTFAEGAGEHGGFYSQAFSGGEPVGAMVSQLPWQEEPPAWTLYFATPDIKATAARVMDNGGSLLMEPLEIGRYGSLLLARDPGDVPFAVWQGDRQHGFGRRGEPGAFRWAEIVTRDADAADAFFPAVFPFETRRVPEPPGTDHVLWLVAGVPVAGRLRMPPETPDEAPPRIDIHFAVGDCDLAVATVRRLGGRLLGAPADGPHGRSAAVADPLGAAFVVADRYPARTR
ncbi:VOC family protein [Streptomyces sp. NBC_01803]|uniref:VOC family protein n=1 Tax=Streptomyces sp. NBC_01803 TaxID=2975946 RepID=UPI002DDA778E|nr:VOC family protein [Streptomyces sp. NBC_01803]WSA45567.1 VOC family protein [Streptomyces sp. NBC_01803]